MGAERGSIEEHERGDAVSHALDTDPLEADIAKLSLFIMKLDECIVSTPPIGANSLVRGKMDDLRKMMAAHRQAMRAELHQLRTSDS